MQTIQFIPCTEGGAGTSLRGSIQASFADLKEMFGEPAYEGVGDKITTEFVIDYQVSDGEGDRNVFSFGLPFVFASISTSIRVYFPDFDLDVSRESDMMFELKVFLQTD